MLRCESLRDIPSHESEGKSPLMFDLSGLFEGINSLVNGVGALLTSVGGILGGLLGS